MRYIYNTPFGTFGGNEAKEVLDNTAITPFDADTVVESDLSTYNSFNKPADWKPASAFDASLVEYYQGNYALRTVAQLGATVEDTDFVTTHYGDWPAPEIFVFNTAS